MALGLVDSEVTDNWWSQNTRRAIMYKTPEGSAPLTGLLSLQDTEFTPMPEFGWHEDRWAGIRTTTVAGPTANTVFYLTGTTTTAGATPTLAAGTTYRIYLTDVSELQADDVITIHRFPQNTGASSTNLTFRVVSKNTTGTDYVEAACVYAPSVALVNNAASAVGKNVILTGSAYAEGSRSRSGRYTFPIKPVNYTQIHKTPFEMTRTALKEPTTWDKSGSYKHHLKKSGMQHMAGIEWSALFGQRRTETATDPDTGDTVRRSFSGGLMWYLQQYELGSVANGAVFDYRGASAANLTAETDFRTYTDKRIILQAGAAMNRSDFNFMEGLAFRKVNTEERCKLCLCGSDYFTKVNESFERQVQVTQMRGEQYKGWDFEMNMRRGPAGTIYYKTHPLFDEYQISSSALYVDLGYIKYRPLADSDTDVQKMIQLPDADKRKDQFLTECGFEVNFPEAHLFVDNMGNITL